jgi:hypothetical protein
MRLAILIEPALRRAYRHQVVEAVATLNAHVIRHRAQPMRRIQIAIPLVWAVRRHNPSPLSEKSSSRRS